MENTNGAAQIELLSDPECICKGNWRLIVREAEPMIGRKFKRDSDGAVFSFFGIVHADDDYYYGMWSKESGLVLRSCVGPLLGDGYMLIVAERH